MNSISTIGHDRPTPNRTNFLQSCSRRFQRTVSSVLCTTGEIMSLENTINKIGHYAKKAAKTVITPINTAIALVTLGTALSFNPIQAQNNPSTEVTKTGYGNLFIKNEDNNPVENATITWTPVDIPGDSIPDPYTYITDHEGVINYEVLVLHTIIDDMPENNYDIEVIQARPNPSTDFTFNYISNTMPTNPVEIFDMTGRKVLETKLESYVNNIAIFHTDLSNQANGIYFATTNIAGKAYTNKIIKINGATVGNLGSSAKESVSTNMEKSTNIDEAIYDISIEAEGYHTLTDQRTVIEEDNGWGGYTLISSAPQPIDNQDLEGYVWKLENTNLALPNAQVRATVNSTGAQYNATSDANGHFVINGLPLGEEITFDVGGITGRYSFAGTNYTTPSSIDNPADSVNSNFGAVLPLKLASSSANHIRDQTRNGTNQDIICFYLGNTLNTTEKNYIRNSFISLQSDENNVYIFAESNTQLNNTGINIEFGTYNTQSYTDEINTPIGSILHPVIYANSTMSTGNYFKFVHEIKRALGFSEVAWVGVESVMETPVQNYTQEDKDIAQFVERPYWNSVYQENKTWIDLNKIVEEMPSNKSMQSKNTATSLHGDVEFNYNSK